MDPNPYHNVTDPEHCYVGVVPVLTWKCKVRYGTVLNCKCKVPYAIYSVILSIAIPSTGTLIYKSLMQIFSCIKVTG
jgi:hypothetical protein